MKECLSPKHLIKNKSSNFNSCLYKHFERLIRRLTAAETIDKLNCRFLFLHILAFSPKNEFTNL